MKPSERCAKELLELGLDITEPIDTHVLAKFIAEQTGCDEMLEAVERCIPWMGKLIADGIHEQCAKPQDAILALTLAEAAVAKAEGATR